MKNRFELKFIVVILNQLMTSQDEIKWNALWVGVGDNSWIQIDAET